VRTHQASRPSCRGSRQGACCWQPALRIGAQQALVCAMEGRDEVSQSTFSSDICEHIYAHTRVHARTRAHTHTHACMHIRAHTHRRSMSSLVAERASLMVREGGGSGRWLQWWDKSWGCVRMYLCSCQFNGSGTAIRVSGQSKLHCKHESAPKYSRLLSTGGSIIQLLSVHIFVCACMYMYAYAHIRMFSPCAHTLFFLSLSFSPSFSLSFSLSLWHSRSLLSLLFLI